MRAQPANKGKGASDAAGVTGLKSLGVRDLTYRLAFLAVGIDTQDTKVGLLFRIHELKVTNLNPAAGRHQVRTRTSRSPPPTPPRRSASARRPKSMRWSTTRKSARTWPTRSSPTSMATKRRVLFYLYAELSINEAFLLISGQARRPPAALWWRAQEEA